MARPPKHGMSYTRTYKSWGSMLERCNNPKAPNYGRYGGRGISVCSGWAHFENFLAYMGERPAGMTLERVDTNGNYEPGNCKWATASEQQRNKRAFRQPPDRVYGERLCGSCLAPYTAKSPVSKRCPLCQPGRRKIRYET